MKTRKEVVAKVEGMFVNIFIGFGILYVSKANDVLSSLWDEANLPLSAAMVGARVSDSAADKLVFRLSMVPFTELMKSDAWYSLVQNGKVEELRVNDWRRYESLIPYLPLSMLRRVNFSNDEILTYFGQLKLSQIQLPQLAEEAMLRNKNIFDKEEEILKLGNIICGFTEEEMLSLTESMLRSLLRKNFFQSIQACNLARVKQLSSLLKKYTVVGPPRTWSVETVKQVGNLLAGLKPAEFRELNDKCFTEVSCEVIEMIPVEVLKAMKNSQLRNLNRSALLAWRRKTQDLRWLYGNHASRSIQVSLPIMSFALLLN